MMQNGISLRLQQSGGDDLERVLTEAGAAVNELASGVEVAEVPGGLLDHVEHDEAQIRDPFVTSAVAPAGWRGQWRRCDERPGSGDLVAVEREHCLGGSARATRLVWPGQRVRGAEQDLLKPVPLGVPEVLDELQRGPTGRERSGTQLSLVKTLDDLENTFALCVEEREEDGVGSVAVNHTDVLAGATSEFASGYLATVADSCRT